MEQLLELKQEKVDIDLDITHHPHRPIRIRKLRNLLLLLPQRKLNPTPINPKRKPQKKVKQP